MDFDHTSGLRLVKDSRRIMAAQEEIDDSRKYFFRYVKTNWNFAHVDLDLSDKSVVVENVHLSDSLMQLSYNIVKNSK